MIPYGTASFISIKSLKTTRLMHDTQDKVKKQKKRVWIWHGLGLDLEVSQI